ADRSHGLPLSLPQQRLWFIDQLEGAGAAYHIADAFRLHGDLDVAVFQRALDRVQQRHESLRTRFQATAEGGAEQVIDAAPGFALRHWDLSALSEAEREAAIGAHMAAESEARFDLSQGPLVRGRLLRCGTQQHVLLVTMHHIISDGWSTGVLVREVSALYAAFLAGAADPLPALPIQYADYAVWQRQWLQGAELARQMSFWRAHL
ncbi:hypothetical protein JWH16_00380, partial [Xanthomonas campestris pv. campestris]|uniref:condensation domain-containing protein n=1 Tax=Xanthomonas campestris TaxID=339 RepID=UPI001E642D5F